MSKPLIAAAIFAACAFVFLAAMGIAMTVVPDFTTTVANAVGVGRGADLFFYLAILGLAFVCLLLYSRIRELQESITELTRALAIKRADTPGPPPTNPRGNS